MNRSAQKVSVADLVTGLYVAELDRPWMGTPFLFQGFELQRHEEIETLGRYCTYVFVDSGRSQARALAALADKEGGAESRSADQVGAGWPHAHEVASDRFRLRRHPDGTRLLREIEVARQCSHEARAVVQDALDDARLGRLIDTPRARDFIETMVESVAQDARTALWLTSLKQASHYTCLHSVHVCVLALAFGMHLGMDRRELVRLGMGALLHDIGKARIPQSILDKPGPLTAEEVEIVKRHPQEGHDMVATDGHAPPEALQIIRLHHERATGCGYPLALTGERIPRYVRIAALADTYDAMTTDRPYRDGIDSDRTLQLIHDNQAQDFGPDLVEEFIRCIGIFPEGSLVQLDNGAIGMVVASPPQTRLQPVILMLQGPDGEPYDERWLVNLSVPPAGVDSAAPRRIARAVGRSACGVDVGAIMARELGLAL